MMRTWGSNWATAVPKSLYPLSRLCVSGLGARSCSLRGGIVRQWEGEGLCHTQDSRNSTTGGNGLQQCKNRAFALYPGKGKSASALQIVNKWGLRASQPAHQL